MVFEGDPRTTPVLDQAPYTSHTVIWSHFPLGFSSSQMVDVGVGTNASIRQGLLWRDKYLVSNGSGNKINKAYPLVKILDRCSLWRDDFVKLPTGATLCRLCIFVSSIISLVYYFPPALASGTFGCYLPISFIPIAFCSYSSSIWWP